MYDRSGHELGKVGGFTGNDAVGWDGPGTIEIGSSNDFFALDQHAARIVRIDATGKIVRSYPLRAAGENAAARLWSYGFRVSEAAQQFYFIADGKVQCRGFDGVLRWTLPTNIGGDPWGGFSGGFDVDADGRLFMTDGTEAKVRIFDVQGQLTGEVVLDMGERSASPQRRISHLRVFGDDLIVRQKSDTEIFQVYDRTTGAFRRSVNIDHERLTVAYPSPVWTAGVSTPLSIQFDAGGRGIRPRLAAWLRPLGTVTFTPLPVRDDMASVPANSSGLFQLRVGSGLDGSNSEYQVESVVEIRPENASGSLSIFTPWNRRSYRSGEGIPFTVLWRSTQAPATRTLDVRLLDQAGTEHGAAAN